MVKIEGKILKTSILILIDPGSCQRYVSPKIVDICKVGKVKQDKPWMVQLATGTKQKVSEIVNNCEVNLNGFPTRVNLNILPLGSYDILIGMDWLEQCHVMLDCLHKSILCIDGEGNQVKVQEIPKKVSVRKISSLEANKCVMKECKLFAVNIRDIESEKEKIIEDFPVLVEFKDVFTEEILVLPMKRDLYFSIELT